MSPHIKDALEEKTQDEVLYFYDGGAHDFSEGKRIILYSKSRPEILRYNSVQLKYHPLRSWYVSNSCHSQSYSLGAWVG